MMTSDERGHKYEGPDRWLNKGTSLGFDVAKNRNRSCSDLTDAAIDVREGGKAQYPNFGSHIPKAGGGAYRQTEGLIDLLQRLTDD